MAARTTSEEAFARELADPFQVSAEAKRFYQEKGYVKLKQVLSEALLHHYSGIITDAVFRLNTLTKPMAERTTYEKAFLQVMNLWREDEAIKGLFSVNGWRASLPR